MEKDWKDASIEVPDLFSIMGAEISEYVLVCDIKEKSTTIATLWITEDGRRWRDMNGGTVKPTHWQYIKLPKE